MAHYVALTCEALARSVYEAAATSPHTISIRLFRQGLHNTPHKLRHTLQDEIDSIEDSRFDAILLVYGMCGNSTVGLRTGQTPIVLPRAHDCITLYLGSNTRYQEEFNRHPGTYWYSVDYIERNDEGNRVMLGAADIELRSAQYDEYVQKFGQETADMLIAQMQSWMQHYTRTVFIDTGLGDNTEAENMAQQKAAEEGWIFERLQGNRRMIEMLVNGDWPTEEFLQIPPGHVVVSTGGHNLIEAKPDGSLHAKDDRIGGS